MMMDKVLATESIIFIIIYERKSKNIKKEKVPSHNLITVSPSKEPGL